MKNEKEEKFNFDDFVESEDVENDFSAKDVDEDDEFSRQSNDVVDEYTMKDKNEKNDVEDDEFEKVDNEHSDVNKVKRDDDEADEDESSTLNDSKIVNHEDKVKKEKKSLNEDTDQNINDEGLFSSRYEVKKVENKHVENNSQANNIGSGIYISYEVRVMSMILLSILFFGMAGAFIIEAITHNESQSVSYTERSDVDYKVCLEENSDYSESCLGQNMQYLSLITKNIPVTFNYDVKLSSPIDYSLDYYVVGSLKIVDRDDNQKVLYTSEDVLVPNTNITNQNDTIQFSSNVEVDYKSYNNYVTGYKSRYSLNSDAYLDVILYLNEGNGPRRVSSLTIPLGVQTYGISKSQTLNNKDVVVKEKKWTSRNYIPAAIGIVCTLVGLVILIKLVSLIVKVSTVKSKYQRKLAQLLREYDRVIVVARNGYELNENKKLIKVLSFNELLDARDSLEKPIIYVKINEVKSEFYVEDVDRVYQYVMKEADF